MLATREREKDQLSCPIRLCRTYNGIDEENLAVSLDAMAEKKDTKYNKITKGWAYIAPLKGFIHVSRGSRGIVRAPEASDPLINLDQIHVQVCTCTTILRTHCRLKTLKLFV